MHFFPSNYTHWYKNTVAFWTSDASKKVLTDIKYTTVFSEMSIKFCITGCPSKTTKNPFTPYLGQFLIIYEKNLY